MKEKLLRNLNKKYFQENVKQVFIFIKKDQLIDGPDYGTLAQQAHSIFDFTNYGDKSLLTFINFNDLKIPSSKIMTAKFNDKELILELYVDEKTQIEKKDPDALINSTFKLGVNKQEQNNK